MSSISLHFDFHCTWNSIVTLFPRFTTTIRIEWHAYTFNWYQICSAVVGWLSADTKWISNSTVTRNRVTVDCRCHTKSTVGQIPLPLRNSWQWNSETTWIRELLNPYWHGDMNDTQFRLTSEIYCSWHSTASQDSRTAILFTGCNVS